MPPTHLSRPSPARRAGITIVEVLTALVVLTVGLLGMAGSSALALRTTSASTLERRALRRLDLRHAALASAGCSRAASGMAEDTRNGLREWWIVGPVVRGAVLVDAGVEWRDGAKVRTLARRGGLLC